MKKNDFNLIIIFLFQFICLVLIFIAVKFEFNRNPSMFVLFSGIFLVLIGIILAMTTKMKWSDFKKRSQNEK